MEVYGHPDSLGYFNSVFFDGFKFPLSQGVPYHLAEFRVVRVDDLNAFDRPFHRYREIDDHLLIVTRFPQESGYFGVNCADDLQPFPVHSRVGGFRLRSCTPCLNKTEQTG